MPGVDGVGGLPCLLLPARASPAPWGGGLYEACGLRPRSAVRGSGYFRGSSISWLVVVLSRHPPSSACLLRRSLCRLSPIGLLASFSPAPLLCSPCSRAVSYRPPPPVPSTSRAGRSLFACLIRCGSRPAVPVFACPRGSSSPVSISCGRRPVLVVASARVSSPFSSRSCLPVLRQAWAGSVAARSLLACLVRSRLRFPFVRACGVVGRCVGVGVGCVRFVVSLFVYINRVPARVS